MTTTIRSLACLLGLALILNGWLPVQTGTAPGGSHLLLSTPVSSAARDWQTWQGCQSAHLPGVVLVGLHREKGNQATEVQPESPATTNLNSFLLSLPPWHTPLAEVLSTQDTEIWAVRAPAGQECAALENLRRDPRVAFAELDYAAHSTDACPACPEPGRGKQAQRDRQPTIHIHRTPLAGTAVAASNQQLTTSNPRDGGSRQQLATSNELIPDDPGWTEQWGPTQIKAPAAWSIVTGTPEIVIAVLDSGIHLGHEDLMNKLWANPREIPANQLDDDGNGKVDDVYGWHFFHRYYNGEYHPDEDANLRDDYGHGTHVSGIAAAATNNGRGIAGIAWGARVMTLKVLDQYGNGWYSDIAAGIVYAAGNGAQIINLSLGGEEDSQTLRAAVDYARSRGALVIASAGNTGDPVFYPAAYEPVLAVAATTPEDRRASFSNYGPEVDLAAPGVDIYSTWYRGNYFTRSGTSMAAPHVSGAAALLWSCWPDLAASEVISILLDTADDIGETGFDPYTGWGRVNAHQAVAYTPSHYSTHTPALVNKAGRHFITYTLALSNQRPHLQTHRFTYTLDARLNYVKASWGPTGTLRFPTYEWAGTINGYQSLTFTLVASLAVAPGQAPTAVTTTLKYDDLANSTTVTIPMVTRIELQPDLWVHKTAPLTARPAEVITYTIHYRNNGDGTAHNVWLIDTLPGGAIPLEPVSWQLGTIAPHSGPFTQTLPVTVTTPGLTLTNRVEIYTTDADANLADNTDQAETFVGVPAAPPPYTTIFLPILVRDMHP